MNPENDPIRAYAQQNAALAATKPKSTSWVLPFLAALAVTALILAAVYFLWGR
jgi:hypothetical protein